MAPKLSDWGFVPEMPWRIAGALLAALYYGAMVRGAFLTENHPAGSRLMVLYVYVPAAIIFVGGLMAKSKSRVWIVFLAALLAPAASSDLYFSVMVQYALVSLVCPLLHFVMLSIGCALRWRD